MERDARTFASENADGKNAIETGISPAALKVLALIPHTNLPGTSNNYSVAGTYSLDRFSFDEKVNWQVDPEVLRIREAELSLRRRQIAQHPRDRRRHGFESGRKQLWFRL